MHNAITAWLLALMTHAAPPERLAVAPQLPGYEETAQQKLERYTSIAQDLYSVVYAPDFKPLFAGSKGRAQTAALVLGIAFHESGFAKDVDQGPCYRGKAGGKFTVRCDGGTSACLMQVKVGEGVSEDGWSQADLFADRTKCFRAGIRRLRRSLRACSKGKPDHRLAAYAAGVCDSLMGQKRSRELFGQSRQFVGLAPLPGPDASFLIGVEGDAGRRELSQSVP